ncbi:MAG TPA: nitronate monooxygenase family protein [Stellaceae bacterium]|jgi:nitronate monooxygenase|nr:nitronate monooxygenase family protein [Stellaceae bacterium]
MPIPAVMHERLRLPVIGAPMFIVSVPALVIAQCQAGIVGCFPALNARPKEMLEIWIVEIKEALAAFEAATGRKAAPFAVNQIVHASNDRLEHDVAVCVRQRVPIVITSLRPPSEVVEAVHSYDGIVLHDVISIRHAEKALEQGVDGLILVCAGAGGHAGTLSPFALVSEIRRFYDGMVILSGAITNGRAILAAQAIGADLAYIGTRFIATSEANAAEGYKRMLVENAAKDIVYTDAISGVHGNYLRPSLVAAGLDPDNLPEGGKGKMNFAARERNRPTAWRDIWGAGQGLGSIDDVPTVAVLVERLRAEYAEAGRAFDAARLTIE